MTSLRQLKEEISEIDTKEPLKITVVRDGKVQIASAKMIDITKSNMTMRDNDLKNKCKLPGLADRPICQPGFVRSTASEDPK